MKNAVNCKFERRRGLVTDLKRGESIRGESHITAVIERSCLVGFVDDKPLHATRSIDLPFVTLTFAQRDRARGRSLQRSDVSELGRKCAVLKEDLS